MNKIKSLLTLFTLFLVCSSFVKAQETVPATGGEATGTGGSQSYTVGQVAYETISTSSNIQSQGVQQAYEIYLVGEKQLKGIQLTCTVFPNPAVSSVNLQISDIDFKDLSFSLFDMAGKQIISEKINSTHTTIPFQDLANATYILKITGKENQEVQTFKIIKNQ
jgi:hypothetical protein